MTEEIIDVKDILLPGAHNLENVCAAVMAATLAGVSKETMVQVLKSFKGLEHRLELVGEISAKGRSSSGRNGVRYYDDSFSTTPETAIAAIQSFKEPEILILGGSSKGSDFTELGKVISEAKNIKAIIGIGIEWPKIKSKIHDSRIENGSRKEENSNRILKTENRKSQSPLSNIHNQFLISNNKFLLIEDAKDMKEIVEAAAKIATPGDVVLLSPACASFDMFKNYKERGEQFKKEVLSLKNDYI